MYYLFLIKDNYNSEYLYKVLKKLKNINIENYNYGITLYYNICNLFNIDSLKHYIKSKTNMKYINNRFYIDDKNYIELRKSSCIIKGNKYLKEILCMFYIYNKNIFVCNFDIEYYFWIKEFLNNNK